MSNEQLPLLIEALLLAANTPLTETKILSVFAEEERPSLSEFREAMYVLEQSCSDRGFELVELASGYTFIAKAKFAPWIQNLWEEKVPKYSKALLETLAIIAYRQPVTRGEIEDIRGVSVSSSIFKTLHEERGWVKVIGHRDVPGRPGIYATTKEFLDYFGLNSLDQLPPVSEILNSFEEQVKEDNHPKQEELELEDETEISSTENELMENDSEVSSAEGESELLDNDSEFSSAEDENDFSSSEVHGVLSDAEDFSDNEEQVTHDIDEESSDIISLDDFEQGLSDLEDSSNLDDDSLDSIIDELESELFNKENSDLEALEAELEELSDPK